MLAKLTIPDWILQCDCSWLSRALEYWYGRSRYTSGRFIETGRSRIWRRCCWQRRAYGIPSREGERFLCSRVTEAHVSATHWYDRGSQFVETPKNSFFLLLCKIGFLSFFSRTWLGLCFIKRKKNSLQTTMTKVNEAVCPVHHGRKPDTTNETKSDLKHGIMQLHQWPKERRDTGQRPASDFFSDPAL
jgi:hypothetical protein